MFFLSSSPIDANTYHCICNLCRGWAGGMYYFPIAILPLFLHYRPYFTLIIPLGLDWLCLLN